MAIDLVPVQAQEIEPLAAFLKKHFRLPEGSLPLVPANMTWKYFTPRPDWDGPRSFLLKSGDRWLAHVAVCPMPLVRCDESVRGMLLVDWVSAAPGAGAEIYRRFYPLTEVLFGNGGSTGARRTIENLGYPVVGAVDLFSRPLKPWKLFRSRANASLGKAAVKFARDTALAAAPLCKTDGWRTEPVRRFTTEHVELCVPDPETPYWQTERSPELLNYFLQCPFARVTAHIALWQDRPRGYFFLADFGEEIRVAELRVLRPDDWAAVVALTARAAVQSEASYLTLSATLETMRAALRANNFRWMQKDPLYLYDPQGRLPDAAMHITPFDGDQAYL